MIIANPIYDVVFKYLLEDLDIARELLSTILGEEILSLDLKPQEKATENSFFSVSIFRLCFRAIIKKETGELEKSLIEFQKVKKVFNVTRFEHYLEDNFKQEATILDDKSELERRSLPVVSVYFLGFPLDNIKRAVVKINRGCQDVVTQEMLDVKDDFVELLTHDSYLIQLQLLAGKSRTKLEKVLQVFNPQFTTEDEHHLDFDGNLNEPLVQKMVDRLERALAREAIRNSMDLEDEISRIFQRGLAKVALEKDNIIADVRQELVAKDQELEAKSHEIEVFSKELEELRKQLKK